MNFRYGHQTKFTDFGYLTQSDKWILPRNVVVDSLLSMNVAGYQTVLNFIPEWLCVIYSTEIWRTWLRIIKVPSLKLRCVTTKYCPKYAPAKRTGCEATFSALKKTALASIFGHGVPAQGPGKKIFVPGDIFIYVTGFTRPDPHFLPDEAFETQYEPPAWYLQTFPPDFPKVCAINSMYVNTIGT